MRMGAERTAGVARAANKFAVNAFDRREPS
jgi:hypothetical protein